MTPKGSLRTKNLRRVAGVLRMVKHAHAYRLVGRVESARKVKPCRPLAHHFGPLLPVEITILALVHRTLHPDGEPAVPSRRPAVGRRRAKGKGARAVRAGVISVTTVRSSSSVVCHRVDADRAALFDPAFAAEALPGEPLDHPDAVFASFPAAPTPRGPASRCCRAPGNLGPVRRSGRPRSCCR